MPILAQVDAVQATALEYDLLERAGLIGAIYGVLVLAGLFVTAVFVVRWRRRPLPLRAAMARLLDLPWRGGDLARIFAVLAAGLMCVFLLRKSWVRITEAWNLSQASSFVLLQSFFFHILGLFSMAVLLARRGWSWREGFGMELAYFPRDLVKGLLALLAALPVLLVITLLFHIVLHLLGYQTSLQDVAFAIADEPQRWMRAYFVVLAVGLAPAFEEIFFRGLLLPVLARRYGTWAALLVTAFLFAAIHGHLPSFATLFGLSLALGAAYIITGSLTVPIVMHALFNAITIAILISIT